jgi:hypothetical protein
MAVYVHGCPYRCCLLPICARVNTWTFGDNNCTLTAETQPPAPDWRQVAEYVWQNPQLDGVEMSPMQPGPMDAAREALLTAVR